MEEEIIQKKRAKFWLRSKKIEKADVPVKDGISFIKKMLQYLLTEFYESLKEGETWGDVDGHQGIPEFNWMQRGEQIDLHIDNTKTHTFSQHTYLDINIEMAYEFLVYMKLVYQLRDEIPQPFEGDAALDFTNKVYRRYVDEGHW